MIQPYEIAFFYKLYFLSLNAIFISLFQDNRRRRVGETVALRKVFITFTRE